MTTPPRRTPTVPARPQPPRGGGGRTGWRRFLPSWKLVGLVFLGLLVAGCGLVAAAWATTDIPQPDAIKVDQATQIYFADGKTHLGRIGAHDRIDVQLSDVPKPVQDAVLAAEDRNFYHEPGISVTGIARALWVDLRGGDVTQGGSTITQQYAKNEWLSQQRTVTRKLREIVIAMKLDQKWSKQQILQNYLNTVYFGHGTYGIQAASRYYFGTDVQKLDAAQGAVLAALLRGPAIYDPTDPSDAQRARARWHYVLDGMVKLGTITPQQAATMQYPKTHVTTTKDKVNQGPNGFIVEAVHEELLKKGFTDDQINLGGLKVITTIEPQAQRSAVRAETDLFASIVKPTGANPPVSALVAVRPGDGAVVAMYGGRDFGAGGCDNGVSCFNLATQAMAQPGSSFKPYVLATAINQGIGIKTRMDGPPTIKDPQGKIVHNDSNESCMNCDLVTALARSINTIFVPLADKVGPKNVAQTAHAAGIPDGVPLHDPGNFVSDRIALGVYPVHPIDQAVGFATFAARGKEADPYLVAKVLDHDGHTLYDASTHSNRAFDAGVADDVTYAMQHVVSEGTATAAQLAGGRPAAGKTGTTSDNTNAWFAGFTAPGPGQISAAVWIGHAKKVTPLTDVKGYHGGIYGGTLPAKIWKEFMDGAMAGRPVAQFPPPKYVGKQANVAPSTSAAPITSAAPTTSAAPATTTAAPTTTTTTQPQPSVTVSNVPPPTTTAPLPSITVTTAPSTTSGGGSPTGGPGNHATTSPPPTGGGGGTTGGSPGG